MNCAQHDRIRNTARDSSRLCRDTNANEMMLLSFLFSGDTITVSYKE